MSKSKKGVGFAQSGTKKKSTHKAVTFSFDQSVVATSFSFDPKGAISITTADSTESVHVALDELHERPKGPKSLFRIPIIKDLAPHLSELDQLAGYKTLYCIDTNTREIIGGKLSISCLAMGSVVKTGNGSFQVLYSPIMLFEFHNGPDNPEAFAVSLLHYMITHAQGYRSSDRYAIINDSNLGYYESINLKKLPIFGDVRLAENIDLLYASADTGSSPINLMIKECDKTARRACTHASKQDITLSTAKKVLDGPCARFCYHLLNLACRIPQNWMKLSLDFPLRGV